MKRYSWVVLTNCTPGCEAAYDHWYDTIHLDDLLRVPGIVAARRGRKTDAQTELAEDGALRVTVGVAPAFQFMAIYTIETDDPEAVLRDVVRRANTPDMMISEHMTTVQTILYEDI